MTRSRLYLLGHKIGYSRSPELHRNALSESYPEVSYELLDVSPSELTRCFRETLHDPATLGLNVTKPYKRRIIPMLDGVTPRAASIDAVNTVFRRGGKWWGDNTDAPAFRDTLNDHTSRISWDRALVLGSGGAARAVVYALSGATTQEEVVKVCSRNRTTAERLRSDLDPLRLSTEFIPWRSRGKVSDKALVVNATPLGTGLSPVPLKAAELKRAALVYDLVYSPSPTPLVNAAWIAGVPALDGTKMLQRQAELSRVQWLA